MMFDAMSGLLAIGVVVLAFALVATLIVRARRRSRQREIHDTHPIGLRRNESERSCTTSDSGPAVRDTKDDNWLPSTPAEVPSAQAPAVPRGTSPDAPPRGSP